MYASQGWGVHEGIDILWSLGDLGAWASALLPSGAGAMIP